MKVIAYARSGAGRTTERPQGRIDYQQHRLLEYAAHRAWTIVEIVEEIAMPSVLRPVLAAALDRLNRGEADALLITDMARIGRSEALWTTLWERVGAGGWSVVTCAGAELLPAGWIGDVLRPPETNPAEIARINGARSAVARRGRGVGLAGRDGAPGSS
jgi:DNA invertase Pin-like site-specific DNA recombinase